MNQSIFRMNQRNKGFTIIELLVVIAIIGILSAVVLASLNTARSKGHDAKTKAQLASLRAATEVYYDTTGHYGEDISDACSGDFFGAPGISPYTDPDNYPAGATLSCHTDGFDWAVSALLLSEEGQAWCVDSSGMAKEITGNLGSGDYICP